MFIYVCISWYISSSLETKFANYLKRSFLMSCIIILHYIFIVYLKLIIKIVIRLFLEEETILETKWKNEIFKIKIRPNIVAPRDRNDVINKSVPIHDACKLPRLTIAITFKRSRSLDPRVAVKRITGQFLNTTMRHLIEFPRLNRAGYNCSKETKWSKEFKESL